MRAHLRQRDYISSLITEDAFGGILNLRQDPQDDFMLSMSSDTCEPRNLFSRLFEFDTQILKKKRLSFCL